MTKEEYIKKLIEKELSYLKDNQYRYILDGKEKNAKIIAEHQEKIDLLI